MNLYTDVNLRFVNVIIHFTFAFLAMREYRKRSEVDFKYLPTMAVGFKTSLIGVLGFAIFQFSYLKFINPEFMVYIKDNALMGELLTPTLTTVWLVAEGFAGTLLVSYLGMRYLQTQEPETTKNYSVSPGIDSRNDTIKETA